ncbi:1-deoxy-D-xylulose-5-phosphate reductoisomerase [Clostridium fallax]|uniref:1-deoxy-D-xylulose 5-phosphate reductoisomerase n=1 Tax=Clostridium fallax TaxID=1533 RepID=A0A1M4V2I9_9CLOT|nr:1-deoxy-D-xylulose-5-phosphate reductoisomerase [Clostridium fallax]SHE63196.1 1-deoxy-D-xylulose 5-phosphate reductoisomerase [Clostridium fallax]SQB06580.1 1-deoxy-D-xylulose 5-phosphate reductoisomerase [Clostridium fallax]
MKNISILGGTGSIGSQTLDVIEFHKDKYKLIAISAHKSIEKMKEIIKKFSPKYIVITDKESYNNLKEYLENSKIETKILYGIEGLKEIASLKEVDIVVTSVVGMIGLQPTLEAIRAGKDIALANKETLVVAGEIVMKEAKENGVKILPVDSEHSAIFQCLQGNSLGEIDKILLTASGGPFRGKNKEFLKKIKLEDALNHPNWAMGKKITIDSSTLMNKGLEVIEAHWLFNCNYDDIQVVVHPQSVVHSMIQYNDGAVIAQMGTPDMRLPIQYALNYPKREKNIAKKLDFYNLSSLTFEKPDMETFPCLKLAYKAGKIGKLMPTILNGANEALVDLFLNEKIDYVKIPEIIEECMNKFDYNKEVTVENIISMDKEVREYIYNNYK